MSRRRVPDGMQWWALGRQEAFARAEKARFLPLWRSGDDARKLAGLSRSRLMTGRILMELIDVMSLILRPDMERTFGHVRER